MKLPSVPLPKTWVGKNCRFFNQWRGAVGALAMAGMLFLVLGCNSWQRPLSDMVVGPGYNPSNFFQAKPILPKDLRRVAFLPLAADGYDTTLMSGAAPMEQILYEALGRLGRFEVVRISSRQMQVWTGKVAWPGDAVVPKSLLVSVQQQTGCEGVLFCRLTQYRPYPPLAVGLNIKLMMIANEQVFWAIDEVFDAQNEQVVNSARRFQRAQQTPMPALADSWPVLNTPTQFGRYAAHAAWATLPQR